MLLAALIVKGGGKFAPPLTLVLFASPVPLFVNIYKNNPNKYEGDGESYNPTYRTSPTNTVDVKEKVGEP